MIEYQIQKTRFENQPAPLNAEYSGILNEQIDRREDREAGRIYAWHTESELRGKFWIDGMQHLFSFSFSNAGKVMDKEGNEIGIAKTWQFTRFAGSNNPDKRVKFWIDGKVFRGSLWKTGGHRNG